MKETAEKNLAEGKAFLEENKRKEGVKTLPSGLQYKVMADGFGKKPKPPIVSQSTTRERSLTARVRQLLQKR